MCLGRDGILSGTQNPNDATPLSNNVLLPRMHGITTQDVPDGVSTLLLDCLPASQQPLALVGGNCSIQGFDATGVERHATISSPLSGKGYCTRYIAASARDAQSMKTWLVATTPILRYFVPAFVTPDTLRTHKPIDSGRLLEIKFRQ